MIPYKDALRINLRKYVAGRNQPVKGIWVLPPVLEPCEHVQYELFLGGDLC